MNLTVNTKKQLADVHTPVELYLKIRDRFHNSIMLESSDYRVNDNNFSYICFKPIAGIKLENNTIFIENADKTTKNISVEKHGDAVKQLEDFLASFKVNRKTEEKILSGLMGYMTYDCIEHFETLKLNNTTENTYKIPDFRYHLYKYIIAFNHYNDEIIIQENLTECEESEMDLVETIIEDRRKSSFKFSASNDEKSNISDEDYMEMVDKGKEHCAKGDVFQIVLSRQFSQTYSGDDFNAYRALRSINPSPYLYYFDYGNYRILGSSPEAEIKIQSDVATINPIAGTVKRTGDKKKDAEMAKQLLNDPKENAEHVMLVDLARNDLSIDSENVKVETYREVQYYSHVIHLVSTVKGKLNSGVSNVKMTANTFPAGTLSGAPKFKALQLIDKYENQRRGYYGGCIGYLGFNNDTNQAIMIRTFLSKDNTLYYQAGAGIVNKSIRENELQEVNNKLMALKKAIELAEKIK